MLRRFTVDELHRMAAAGIVGDEVQLVGGRIVARPEPAAGERAAVAALARHLESALGAGYDVRLYRPLALGPDSEPWPDVAVARREAGSRPGRPLLVAEAAAGDALRFARRVKGAAYAAAAVPELWIFDVERRSVEVQRSPDAASGTYRVLITLERDAALTSERLPGLALALSALFT
jgi:Uma2 family endonuclease